jgi:hypothetical protein
MDETSIINNIIEKAFAEGYGFWMLLLLAIFFLIRKLLNNEKVSESIGIWFTKRTIKISSMSLKKHPFFLSQPLLRNKINNLIFTEAPYKTIVFKAFFEVKLFVDITKVKEFVIKDFSTIDKDELFLLQDELVQTLRNSFDENIISELEKVCEREISEMTSFDHAQMQKGICARKVFNHVMYSKNGYEESRNKRLESLTEYMELIRDSITFKDNNERNYHFLDLLRSFMHNAILKAEQDFKSFNGDIEKFFNECIIGYK